MSHLPCVALEERTRTGFAGELARVDDDLAARNDGIGGAGHFTAFIRVVVAAHVQRLYAELQLLLRIEDDDVGVRPGSDGALAREQAEDPRRGRRRQLDETVE